ncbi:MAG TPA: MSHA biogenesis protein MshI [Cellvibrio sp.]
MQQINLYLPEFRPNYEPLRSIHMLWGMAAFGVLLLIFSYLSAQGNRALAGQVEKSKAQLEHLKAQVTQMEQQRPTGNLADLDAQSLKLSQELVRREQIYQVIANKNLGNNSGFSAYMEALGRQSLETISLEAFSLERGGNYVEFAGKTLAVDQIPLYIQQLRREPVFAQSAFGVLNAEPHKNKTGVFEFSLAKDSLAREESENAPEVPKTAVQMFLEMNKKVIDQSRRENDAKRD